MAILDAPQSVGRAFGRLKDNFPGHRGGSGTVALTASEAWELFDAKAQAHLGMSADEFERAWKRGDFRGRQEDRAVRRVVMLRTKKPTT
jgi:hypothetical protein